MSPHYLDRSVSTSRWDNSLPPRITIAPGDSITIETRDASDGQVRPDMSSAEFATIDTGRIHGLTGPVAVDGAAPGDALEVVIDGYEHEGWAWTSIIPGLGLLEKDFDKHFLHIWKLEGNQTTSMPGTRLELRPFAGIIGVQRSEAGVFRTRPPGPWGGNMDVRHLTEGARLFLPVFTAGAGLCTGDCHAAQGDGEVSINGMEAPMKVRFTVHLHKDMKLEGPFAITPGEQVPARYGTGSWSTFIESDPDPREAARRIIRRAIDHIGKRIGISREEACVLCSVVLDLKLSQVVNVPMTTVSGYLPEAIFTD
ncbi:MAG: acetamidase/formamidase family protein [Oceanipulchritudo sp.]